MTQYECEKEKAREKIRYIKQYLKIQTITDDEEKAITAEMERLADKYGLKKELKMNHVL